MGLPYGCGRDEVRDFLRYVCEEASGRGENWRFKFREIKFNNSFGPTQLKKKMTEWKVYYTWSFEEHRAYSLG